MSGPYITVHLEAGDVDDVQHHVVHNDGQSSWRLSDSRNAVVYLSGTPDELRSLAGRLEDAAYEYERLNEATQ